jgi:hypothetical protein
MAVGSISYISEDLLSSTSSLILSWQEVTVHSHKMPEIPKGCKKKNKLPLKVKIMYYCTLLMNNITFQS